MSTILVVHRKIRRALQGPLFDAAVAASGTPIQWPGIPFDRQGKDGYLSATVGFGPVIVHEVGRKPLMEASGHISIVIRTPKELGEDGNDALLGIIASAYPYASTPSFGGVSVNIDKMEHRGYGEDGPWLTGLVAVHWNIYRRDT